MVSTLLANLAGKVGSFPDEIAYSVEVESACSVAAGVLGRRDRFGFEVRIAARLGESLLRVRRGL
jgi:hypothetical protein